jgi:hypothetical protein
LLNPLRLVPESTGRTVVVQQASERNGEMWYRVRGRGVPANAWIRGDLLQGG